MARKSTNNPRPKRRRGMELRHKGSKPCAFCQQHVESIDWKDVSVLRRYISDRGKIRGRRITGNCPTHQRQVANAVKNAREMALHPYVSIR